MKNTLSLCALVGALLLTSCAISQRSITIDTVGPAQSESSVAGTNGTLTVYSGFKVNADFNSPDPSHREYSNYKIYSSDGKLLQLVQNDTGLDLSSPSTVSLAPGKYRIIARANGYGIVTVPVVIQAGKVTLAHLEGGYAWPNKSEFNQTNAVHLPDGAIVGWRATE